MIAYKGVNIFPYAIFKCYVPSLIRVEEVSYNYLKPYLREYWDNKGRFNCAAPMGTCVTPYLELIG